MVFLNLELVLGYLSIVWDVSPEIFSIGPFSIRYYGLLFALNFLIGYFIIRGFFKKEGIPLAELDRMLTYAFIGIIVGARLGHVFFYEPSYYFQHPLEILKVWRGGLASHGAAIGSLIAMFIYSKKSKERFLAILDKICIPGALGAAMVRIGNLMNSEIYGIETNLPWGFIFVQNGETVPKHPTQIYEALSYIVIFGILYFTYTRYREIIPTGFIAALFLILIFTTRFFIEFLKEVQVSFETYMFLNMGQILSIPMILMGILLLIYLWKSKMK